METDDATSQDGVWGHTMTEIPANSRTVDYDKLIEIGRDLLVALGEDPEREGVKDTPRRFAAAWKEFIEYDPGNIDATFESVTTNQLVVVRNLRVWSVCEHHLLPFWCDVSIGYIAREKVLGLSKFARIAHLMAHRPQIQERLVQEIADAVEGLTGSPDVAVYAKGVHLCMVMRGVKTPGEMVTSVVRGMFLVNPAAREEFLMTAKA